MNKDFDQAKLLSFNENKILRVLYELAHFIEAGSFEVDSHHFEKLKKYHGFLADYAGELIPKINAEFLKITILPSYQFEIYMMNLERFLEMSSSEYNFQIESQDKTSKAQLFDIVCMFDSIRSAHNIGSMVRNAECFGVRKICLTGLCPKLDHPQVKKTAMGCEKNIEWEYRENILDALESYKKDHYEVWSVETSTKASILESIKQIPPKLVLVFGHEVYGVNPKILAQSDKTIKISLSGQKNSLNVGMSQAIVLNYITQLLKS